jgi:hypothetical protein
MPVATFLKVTVAPGTMADEESRTAPSTVAVSNWAYAAPGKNRNTTRAACQKRPAARNGHFESIGSSSFR